jgi:hypothetical protein
MIFDTDIFIWVQRGHEKAARLIEEAETRYLSIQTFMELLQGANNKRQHDFIKDFISSFNFQVLPLTENIGHRALVYIEEYAISHHLRAADAIIAATATENNLTLVTGNSRHFKPIQDLKLKIYKP